LRAAGKEISEEEGAFSLVPSSIMLQARFWLKLCARCRQSDSGDINIGIQWLWLF
jgi:hypothetical protein